MDDRLSLLRAKKTPKPQLLLPYIISNLYWNARSVSWGHVRMLTPKPLISAFLLLVGLKSTGVSYWAFHF